MKKIIYGLVLVVMTCFAASCGSYVTINEEPTEVVVEPTKVIVETYPTTYYVDYGTRYYTPRYVYSRPIPRSYHYVRPPQHYYKGTHRPSRRVGGVHIQRRK
jgi:hypothetical protein